MAGDREDDGEHSKGLPGLRQDAIIGNVLQILGADHGGFG